MPLEDRITDFAIDVRLADGTWKRIAEQHVKAPDDWENYSYILSFETVNCTAMRITSANHNGQKTLVFSEIEAFYHGDMSKEDYGMKTVVGNVVKEKTKVVNDCQDKTKLQIEKPMKNLLSGIINNPEVISIVQEYIDKLEAGVEEDVVSTDEEMSDRDIDINISDRHSPVEGPMPPMQQSRDQFDTDMEQQNDDSYETILPTPADLNIGDLGDFGNPNL